MTAHPHGSRRAANPGIDQLATQIRNDRKGRHPELVALEGLEQQLITLFVQVGGEQVHPEQAGTTMLIMGQLLNDLVSKLPPDEQYRAPAVIVNLLRMIGQRLYAGDLPEDDHRMRCPFLYASGKPCKFEPVVGMGGTLTSVMQGHVTLHHPGEVWPPVEDDNARAQERDDAKRGAAELALSEMDAHPFSAPDEDFDEEDPYPLSALGANPSFEQLQRFASLRVMAMTYLATDRDHGDPITGRKGDLTPELAWEIAEDALNRHLAEGVVHAELAECTHPTHARMHLPGGERCAACGAPESAIRLLEQGASPEFAADVANAIELPRPSTLRHFRATPPANPADGTDG